MNLCLMIAEDFLVHQSPLSILLVLCLSLTLGVHMATPGLWIQKSLQLTRWILPCNELGPHCFQPLDLERVVLDLVPVQADVMQTLSCHWHTNFRWAHWLDTNGISAVIESGQHCGLIAFFLVLAVGDAHDLGKVAARGY